MLSTFVITAIAVCMPSVAEENCASLVFCCSDDNDLYRVAKDNNIKVSRFDNYELAIKSSPEGSGVLILADNYPTETNTIDVTLLDEAAKKKLRLYIEYPSCLPNMTVGEPRHTHWERAVISSDAFRPSLENLSILGINDCYFVPVEVNQSHIVVAKVAGLDSAVYGLPDETWPILFEHVNIMVATTKLSQFVTARYAPVEAWRAIWKMIFGWLQPDRAIPNLKWTSVVRPSYAKNKDLPDDVEFQSFLRGVEWFKRSHLLVHESWNDEVESRLRGYQDGVAPLPADLPIGDGRYGFLEGYSSSIRFDGTQPVRYYLRNDCNGEVSMALAFGDPSDEEISANINDFICFNSNICNGPRSDPDSPSYGLHGWDTRPEVGGSGNYYGDDNARGILGTIAASALLASSRWDEAIIRNLIANLRTTGVYGFRQASILDTSLQEHGWEYFLNQHVIHYAPHYQAYLWATFLWAYERTGYKPFLERTKNAIKMTMQAYPDRWQWTNGIQQERARLLLPLAWLVRAEDTPEHRQWLNKIAEDMLKSQDKCGAIREELGDLSRGSYPPPRSNEEYGNNEASLISKNGDPICDLLYTTNFAFIGLHEAASATGDPLLFDAEDKLAKFLCRIQVRSESHPELDGAWFRAFDFNRWDYWGSNADAGWGAWSIESGWTQGWIVAVLAMRKMKTSLWDLTSDSRVEKQFDKYRQMMLPDEFPKVLEKSIKHDAIGKSLTLKVMPDQRYPGSGAVGLVDGEMAFNDHTDPRWHGFEGVDMEATIDMGKSTLIHTLGANFLQSISVGIFLPKKVEFAISDDGQNFHPLASVQPTIAETENGPLTHIFTIDNLNVYARYVRIHATNLGIVPDWHSAKGLKAWIFVDEIIVNPR